MKHTLLRDKMSKFRTNQVDKGLFTSGLPIEVRIIRLHWKQSQVRTGISDFQLLLLAIMTIVPDFLALIEGNTAFVTSIVPKKLV